MEPNGSQTGAEIGAERRPNRSQLKISFYKKASDTTMSDEPQGCLNLSQHSFPLSLAKPSIFVYTIKQKIGLVGL